MEFEFSDEQKALRESCRKFGEKELAPGAQRRDEAGESQFDWDAWRKMAEFNLTGLPIPAEYGGSGLDPLDFCVAMEGLGEGCYDAGLLTTLGAHIVICCIPIWEFGTQAQKEKYLPKLTAGQWVGAWGLTEPNAGSDVASLRTKAEKKGDNYILNGSKTFITNASIADVIIVLATVDPSKKAKGVTAFIVEKGTKGLHTTNLNKMGLKSSPTGEVFLEDVEIPVENRLGDEGQGFAIAMATLEWERACMLPAFVGIAEKRLKNAIAYAKSREQFGQPIANFQAIRGKLADMKVSLEMARLMFYKVAWMKKMGLPAMLEAGIGKLFLSETSKKAAMDAVQIHGGYGYMKEYSIERDLRDSVPMTIGGGSSEIQREIIARFLVG